MVSCIYTRRTSLLRYHPRRWMGTGGFRSEQPRSSPVSDSGERVASCEGLWVSLVRVLLWGVSIPLYGWLWIPYGGVPWSRMRGVRMRSVSTEVVGLMGLAGVLPP